MDVMVGAFFGVFVVALVSHFLIRHLCGALGFFLLLGASASAYTLNTEHDVPLYYAILGCGVVTSLVGFPLFLVNDLLRLEDKVKELKEIAAKTSSQILELENDISALEDDLSELEGEVEKLSKAARSIDSHGLQSPR